MSVIAITGKDTIIVNGRVLVDFADGDNAILTFPNDLMVGKTGKNGNAIIAMNHTGYVSELTLRLIRGTDDDKFLNDLQQANVINYPAISLLSAVVVKNIGADTGGQTQDTYALSNGFFKKKHPDAKENAEGDIEQGVVIYALTFLGEDRSIG